MNALLLALGILLAGGLVMLTRARNLYAAMIAMSVYSALMAIGFSVLEAVDVSFTEAVVGSSISTILVMLLLRRVDPFSLTQSSRVRKLLGACAALGITAVFLYGLSGIAPFGDPQAPPQVHVSPYYVENSMTDMKTPNTVTTVLAGYRGFDTLIETAVVLTAALACMLILGIRDTRIRPGSGEESSDGDDA